MRLSAIDLARSGDAPTGLRDTSVKTSRIPRAERVSVERQFRSSTEATRCTHALQRNEGRNLEEVARWCPRLTAGCAGGISAAPFGAWCPVLRAPDDGGQS